MQKRTNHKKLSFKKPTMELQEEEMKRSKQDQNSFIHSPSYIKNENSKQKKLRSEKLIFPYIS